MTTQTILHLDMDAFFAAVEVMDHPDWAGKPLVVGSPPDKRGVVSTCSYEARKFGIHSAMPSRTAGKLCPHAIFAPVRMSRYMDVSSKIMMILSAYTPVIEQVSVDEAFLDIKSVMRKWKSPEVFARAIKAQIKKDIGLTASVGVATNKFLAKLASDMEKPDGLTVVPAEPARIIEFLAPLPVNRIWGVGKVTESTLRSAGFHTIADLQQVSPSVLAPIVGHALADHISQLARGLDDRSVVTESAAKSISAECTFDDDISDGLIVRQQLVEMIEQVGRRLRQSGMSASTVFIKIRYADFQTMSRQETMPSPVCSDRRILKSALALFDRQKLLQPVRLIGAGVGGLSDANDLNPQLDLFSDPEDAQHEKDFRLDQAMDNIRTKMGDDAIRRASGMSRE